MMEGIASEDWKLEIMPILECAVKPKYENIKTVRERELENTSRLLKRSVHVSNFGTSLVEMTHWKDAPQLYYYR